MNPHTLCAFSTTYKHIHVCVFAGLYTLRCGAFKEMLASSAEALIRKLLDLVRATGRASNIKLHEEFSLMSQEVRQ